MNCVRFYYRYIVIPLIPRNLRHFRGLFSFFFKLNQIPLLRSADYMIYILHYTYRTAKSNASLGPFS